MALFSQFILLIASIIANAFSAIAGGGAGLLQFPVILFMGVPFAAALATHKVATVGLGIGSSLRHWKNGSVKGWFPLYILGAALPGVVLGALIVVQLPEFFTRTLLGLLTIALGVHSFFKKELGQERQDKNRDTQGLIIGGLMLFVIGVFNGSLSSGSGLFLTVLLVQYFGLDYKTAVAHTMMLMGLVMNATGGLLVGVMSHVVWEYIPVLIVGSIVGGFIGAHLSIIKSNRFVKRAFEIVTILVGLKLLLS